MSESLAKQIADLRELIAAQAGQRATLGDAVVDATIAILQEKLAALEIQLTAPPPQQRKLITVLFADVSGYTAMSEALDAEDVTDLMNALWQRLDGAVIAHGGQVDSHNGDEVMALWGVDQARENDPARAIQAALAMQAELADYGAETGRQLAMRIGLNTGPVLLGEIGTTGELSAMGDTVNLASRLEHAAPVGGILISHATYRHVRGLFAVAQQPPLTVKGKTEPVQTYVVRHAKPNAFWMSPRGVEAIETHMVGRDAELDDLQRAVGGVLAGSEAQTVIISGQAGIGKSRLLYECENWMELRLDDALYFKYKGRAWAETQQTPYALFHNLFALHFDIRDSDPAETAMQKFRAGMAAVLPAARADLIGQLVGYDFSGSEAVGNLLGSPNFARLATADVVAYFRLVAADRPLVLFLEDLHWADDGSLALLAQLIAELQAAPLLIVGLARPELFERHPAWADADSYAQLNLTPLAPEDSHALVADILQKVPTIPADLHDLLITGTAGNPFYVEELIKMLIDDGVIVRGEQTWHVEMARLTDLRVPPTLTGVLQARLDSLPLAERITLQRASVVGRQFWDATVAALADAEPDVAPLLERLRDRELIVRQERSAFANTTEYVFQHDILRDVTYETVLRKQRRHYHVLVARWLERHAGDRINEYLSQIAGQYELADEPAQALAYWQRAVQEALKVSAFPEAAALGQQALRLLPEAGDDPTRLAVLRQLADAYLGLSDFPAATTYYEQCLAIAQAQGDLATSAAIRNGLGRVAERQANYPVAHAHLEAALQDGRAVDDRHSIMVSLCRLGVVALEKDDLALARQHTTDSLALAHALGDRQYIAGNENNLGIIAYELQAPNVARGHYEASLAIKRARGDRRGVAATLGNLGLVAYDQGDFDSARDAYEESIAINREIGNRYGIAVSLNNAGLLEGVLGNHAASRQHHEESLRISEDIGDRFGVAASLNNLGTVCYSEGEYPAAVDYHARAVVEFRALKNTRETAASLCNQSFCELMLEQYAAAREYLGEALALIHAIGPPDTVLQILVGIAWLRLAAGDAAQAAAWAGLVVARQDELDLLGRERLGRLQAMLSEQLDPAARDAALARGQALDLEATIKALLDGEG